MPISTTEIKTSLEAMNASLRQVGEHRRISLLEARVKELETKIERMLNQSNQKEQEHGGSRRKAS